MRELLLLRHAKSSWDDASLADVDRPLAARGKRDAPAMGREIARRGWAPQLALVSPARRTRETFELLAPELPGMDASFRDALYESGPHDILREFRSVPSRVQRLLVVGHNPGLEELAVELAGTHSDDEALARLHRKYPTGALVRFTFDGDWADLAAGAARLTHMVAPRDLR